MNRHRGSRCALGLAVILAGSLGSRALAAPLVVSLTFDDGLADDVQIQPLLEARGLRGTFYVISGYLGHTGYLTVAQARALEAAGHEIGGHTVSHPHLPVTPADDAQRELCDDRTNLVTYGLHPQSFAYPYGEYSAAVEQLAAGCGYNSARIVGPITDDGAPVSETIPPKDPFAVITPWSVLNTNTVADLQGWVTAAETKGGWLPIVFHHLCQPGPPCDQYGISVANFTTFLDWLTARASLGTTTKLVREVMGGSMKPLVALANPVMNPSMEYSTDGGVPRGWQRAGSGTNTAVWTTTGSAGAHSGSSAQRVDVTSYTSGTAHLVPTLSVFAPAASPGHLYRVSNWYTSTSPPRWTAYYRDATGAWIWWTQSAPQPVSPGWTQSSFTIPTLPAGATGVAFGLGLNGVGSLTVDDFGLTDLGLAPTQVALTTPANGASVRGQVTLTASATSPAGITRIDLYAGGTLVGSGSTSPASATWNSALTGDGVVTLSASTIDDAGVTATSPPVQVTVTNAAGLLQNPSLESDVAPPDGVPDCWTRAGYGTNTATWSTTSDSHAGLSAQRVDVTAYTNGAQRLVPTQDTGTCAQAGVVGDRYRISTWYKSTAAPMWVAYYRSATGVWTWWAQSALLPAASTWTQATFTTPALPAGATNLSLGLSLYSVGSLTVDDFTLFDLGP